MTTGPHRALSLFTACFASDDIEAAARRPGLVKRAAQLTGTRLLALVPCGAWRDATTTLAPWAAQVPPWDEQGAVAPEAIPPRLHQRALALLQARLPQALAQGPSRDKVCAAGLCTACTQVSLAASTGCARPERRPALVPGSGGSAAKAGAKIQAVWDTQRRGFGPCVLTPWHMPEPKSGDHGIGSRT
jgi:hypothetical protein